MYQVDSRRRLELEGVEVVVSTVVHEKGSKVRVVVYVKYGDRIK